MVEAFDGKVRSGSVRLYTEANVKAGKKEEKNSRACEEKIKTAEDQRSEKRVNIYKCLH